MLWSRILDRLSGPEPPQVIVVDPRRTSTVEMATVHISPKIGTNVAILNAILALLFKHPTAIDEEYVANHTVGWQRLLATVTKYTPEFVEELTGVPAHVLKIAASIIGESKRLLSTVGQGVHQSNQATAAACQVNSRLCDLSRTYLRKLSIQQISISSEE